MWPDYLKVALVFISSYVAILAFQFDFCDGVEIVGFSELSRHIINSVFKSDKKKITKSNKHAFKKTG